MFRSPFVAALLCCGCAAPWAEFSLPLDRAASGRTGPTSDIESLGSGATATRTTPSISGSGQPAPVVASDAARAEIQHAVQQPNSASRHIAYLPADGSPAQRSALGIENETASALMQELSQLPPHYRDMLRTQLLALDAAGATATQPTPAPPYPSPGAPSANEHGVPEHFLPGPDPDLSPPNPYGMLPNVERRSSGDLSQAGFPETAPANTVRQTSLAAKNVGFRGTTMPPTTESATQTRDRTATKLTAGAVIGPPDTRTADARTAFSSPPDARTADVGAQERRATAEASKEVPQSGLWRNQLAGALDLLEQDLARAPSDSPDCTTLAASARLLHVVLNHHERAVAAIDQLPDDEREYWKHQMHALLLALDADRKNASSRRAALALRELRSAADSLANLSSLEVRNLAWCKAVESYGRFTEFHSQSFRPGQEVLLYVEIDNFAVRPVGDKFETELQGVYDILDSAGQRLKKVELPLDKQLGNNRRRDYFVAYRINLPDEFSSGTYTLQLTVEDVKGRKSSQASLDFRIR